MQAVGTFAVNTADSEAIEYQSVVHTARLAWRTVRAQVQRGHDTADLVPGAFGHGGPPAVRLFVSRAEVPEVRKDQDRVRVLDPVAGKAVEYRVMEILRADLGGWELYCAA